MISKVRRILFALAIVGTVAATGWVLGISVSPGHASDASAIGGEAPPGSDTATTDVPSTTIPDGAVVPDDSYDTAVEEAARNQRKGDDPAAMWRNIPKLEPEPLKTLPPDDFSPSPVEPAVDDLGSPAGRSSSTVYHSHWLQLTPSTLSNGTYALEYWVYIMAPQSNETLNCDSGPGCFWFSPIWFKSDGDTGVHTGPMTGESRSGSSNGAWRLNVSGYTPGGTHFGDVVDPVIPLNEWVRIRVWHESTWLDPFPPYKEASRFGVWALVNGQDINGKDVVVEGSEIFLADLFVEVNETNGPCDTDFTRALIHNPSYWNSGGHYAFWRGNATYGTECGDGTWLNLDGDDFVHSERDVARVVANNAVVYSGLPRMQMTNESATHPGVNYDFELGALGDKPVAGDWNGDGRDTVGVHRPSAGAFYTRNVNSPGTLSGPHYYGNTTDVGIVGDWDGDGDDDWGVYRPSNQTFYRQGSSSIAYGNPGDVPIVGDWDNDGVDEIGVFRPSNQTFYRHGESSIPFGNPGDQPVIGNWNASGGDEVGVYRPGERRFYLRYSSTDVRQRYFGANGVTPTPISGDWNDNGRDTVGIWRP